MRPVARRKFIKISAAALGVTGLVSWQKTRALRHIWHFKALGAFGQIEFFGEVDEFEELKANILALIQEYEKTFSLFQPQSALSRLNHFGELKNPSPTMLRLLGDAHSIYQQTHGAFDPSIGSIWAGLARGKSLEELQYQAKEQHFHEVRFKNNTLSLPTNYMSLTFNGIAQGALTDKISEILRDHNLKKALVNMGEYRSIGGPWHIGIENQRARTLSHTKLIDRAIATSSMDAVFIGHSHSHIVSKTRKPRWRTTSVEAENATVADGFSTSFILMSAREIKHVFNKRTDIHEIWLESLNGDFHHIA